MSAPLAFIDTETTSLRADRRAWEIGVVLRKDGHETSHQWFVDSCDLDLGNADVMSLKIGRFYDRHPDVNNDAAPMPRSEAQVLREVEAVTRGTHLIGAVVSFDADVLGQRMRANGICPSWHYHLIDIEALAVGYMAGAQREALLWGNVTSRVLEGVQTVDEPPWKSDELSGALGVTVSDEDRHTALGDARWAMRLYDKVMGA